MARNIIDEEALAKPYIIRPEHIAAKNNLKEVVGLFESEWVIALCLSLGGWFPFSKKQINIFYGGEFKFNHLTRINFVVLGKDGRYRVTHEFITSCFEEHPSKDIFTVK